MLWPPHGYARELGWIGVGHPDTHEQARALEFARQEMGSAEWIEGPLFREHHIGFCVNPEECEWGVWGLLRA
jgi:hypothetical protein